MPGGCSFALGMSSRPPSDTGAPRHPMRVVTRRTGLSADLLRAWEKRYEVVVPERSESGRRIYSHADIERLGLLYRATLAGRSIGQLAGLPATELETLVRQDALAERTKDDGASAPRARATREAASPGPTVSTATDYVRECLDAIERLDASALESLLRRGVVAPVLERVGTYWRDGTFRPVHGHLASAVLRRVLDRVTETATSPSATPSLVVATPAGQLHEFGALLAAATAAADGWSVTYLGPDLPAEDIAEAAARTRARAVALSIVYPAGDPAVKHELRRLAALLPKGVS